MNTALHEALRELSTVVLEMQWEAVQAMVFSRTQLSTAACTSAFNIGNRPSGFGRRMLAGLCNTALVNTPSAWTFAEFCLN